MSESIGLPAILPGARIRPRERSAFVSSSDIRLATTLFILNAVALLATFFIFRFGFRPADPWNTTTGVAQAVLLFDTLIVVWRYTIAAENQVAVMHVQRSDSNKPIAITVTDALAAPLWHVRNVGPGVAVNAFVVVPMGPFPANVRQVGIMGANDNLPMPHAAFTMTNDPAGPPSDHLVVAETLFSRTGQQWVVTLNVIHQDTIFHRVAEFDIPRQPMPLAAFLRSYQPTLDRQLQNFSTELHQQVGN
jgi:hypothetical protein